MVLYSLTNLSLMKFRSHGRIICYKILELNSCIEAIIGLPDIRMHRLIHRIPSYFDTPDPSYLNVQIHSKEEPPEVKMRDHRLSLLANSEVQRNISIHELH